MKTPICDFINGYKSRNSARLHMPGHKGKEMLGFESFDITEINGADSLFEAKGIIAESEENASSLFGAYTFYSTEGCSHCIRAMLYLLKKRFDNATVFAGRNAHKSFLSACALLDIDVQWIENTSGHILSGIIDPLLLDNMLEKCTVSQKAVYITSPDYLGSICDIKRISKVCKKHNALLCVDNAHGAYLKFLPESLHPIDLGADICCDSAHKTLPVITGGAYLHISKSADGFFHDNAKSALSLFGSTSPSYLILQSLDKANAYISDGYQKRLSNFIREAENAKKSISDMGYTLCGNEALKIVILAKEYGYYGFELAEILEKHDIFCEFSDPDYTVFMLTPENGKKDLLKLVSALASVRRKEKINKNPPYVSCGKRCLSLKEALFKDSEVIDVSESEGRILAQFNVSCPPAVPIAVCGEIIDKTAIEALRYYGIEKISVIK